MKKCKRISWLVLPAFLILSSCGKEDQKGQVPVLTTSDVIGITSTTAICGGDITSDEGSSVTERGICWSTSQAPTISDNKSTVGTGTGSFISDLRGLSGNTTYYVSAYATNSAGTGYGSGRSFTTPRTVTDVDGNVYSTAVIGTQTWMAENLKVIHYRNGDLITYISVGENWGTSKTEEYCDYDLIGSIGDIYGNFYNWYAVADSRNIAPEGWHVPTDAEWTILIDYLGGANAAGAKMKELRQIHWHPESVCAPNSEVTNSSGFSALAAGYSGDDHRGWEAHFWTASEQNALLSFRLAIDCSNDIWRGTKNKTTGLSVRCVKD